MPIHVEIKESIAILRMDCGAHNRFNPDFIDEFERVLDQFESGQKAKALVITNKEGNYFTEGMDIEWAMTRSGEELVSFFLRLFKFLHRVFMYPLPVIAAINGHAVASGLAFALCSDYRVMRKDKAACIFPEVDLRIEPPPGCLRMVIHAIGNRNAEKAFLSAMPYKGEDALRMGFIDELAESGRVLDRAVTVAKHLSTKPFTTYAAMKNSLRSVTARNMIEDDEKYIKESHIERMFQGCDLDCLKMLN